MVQTITTDFQFVTDGETTVENPGSIVGNENIIISNAEIQWQGTTETSSSTSYNTNTNSGSATATSSTSTDTASNIASSVGDGFQSSAFPSVPSGYNFDYHELTYTVLNKESSSVTVDILYEAVNGGNVTDTITLNADQSKTYNFTTNNNFVNGGRSIQQVNGSNNLRLGIICETYGIDTTTTVNSDTTTVSYPSVPSGHSFDRHYYREEKNGSFVDSDYIYTNKVGDTRSVTSNDPSNTWELTMQTRGEQTVTTTTETQDPSVSGDVSAAYNGALGSQEYSSWQPLSGFELGDNSFVHDIGGTNEAFYQIRFDYELSFPTTVAEAYIHVGNTTYPVILADPSDPNLVYDFYRVNHPTHGELAFDVVNTTNADATPYTVTDGNGNVRALRENTQ